jgi:predicted TIM-barrel fold metal-dependent hydrolase
VINATATSIDCDVHVSVPDNAALLPFLPPYWQDQVVSRGIEALDLATYPPKNPLSARADWRPAFGKPGTDLALLKQHALEAFGSRYAICNVIYGAQAVLNADLGVALCRAVNDWLIKEWLDRDPRLRASIVIPMQDAAYSVTEIDRCAADLRFVQILMLATGDVPFGRRQYWPVYEAACRHRLPIGLHPGHSGRYASTYVGWPSSHIEDYAAQAQSLQGQLLSLIYEGVFSRYPTLKVVVMESGVSWLPGFMWRADNTWRAMRNEVPWVDKPPSEILREHVRLTTQPFDVPDDAATVSALLEQFPADEMLLFASDFPHWQFDGVAVLPPGLTAEFIERISVRNPLETYSRLSEQSS